MPTPPLTQPPEVREVASDDATHIALTQQYFDELRVRFEAFEAPAVESLLDDARSGGAFVAFDHLGPMACATLRLLDPLTAEVKRMFVHPRARGRGVGEAMLVALENAASARGCTRIVLDTHASLVEAARLYRRLGYRDIERYNDNPYAALWFEKRVPTLTSRS